MGIMTEIEYEEIKKRHVQDKWGMCTTCDFKYGTCDAAKLIEELERLDEEWR